MRTDMRKVLIERPRYGHSRSYHAVRTRQNRADDLDDLPSCEGMRRPYNWGERKEFSDLLGPLERYLWSCRGRKWDDVWAEISAQLSNNTVDSHLKHVHVPQFIETHTVLIDGEVYCRGRYVFGTRVVTGLYVHPVTGLVCGEAKERNSWKRDKAYMLDGIAYDKGEDDVLRPRNWSGYYRNRVSHYSRKIIEYGKREAVFVGCHWYWVIFAEVPAPSIDNTVTPPRTVKHVRTDFVTGETVREGRYRADKRQMGAPDLRRHGLINA